MGTIRDEFIWTEDKYVYHLTNVPAMKGIIKSGLIPQIGDRSKSVGDDIEGIFFFFELEDMRSWAETIYDEKDIYSVELLRFNIKGLEWHVHYMDIDGLYIDHYLPNGIPRDKIEYARMYDRKTGLIQTLTTKTDNPIITWNPINKYKPINPGKALYLSDKQKRSIQMN